jgi:hypothetical protein
MPKSSLISGIEKFWSTSFIDQKLNNWIGYILFPAFAVAIGYLYAHQELLGIGFTGVALSLAVVIICLLSTEAGLYIIVIYSFFAFAITRFISEAFPVGVVIDVLTLATLFSLFVKKIALVDIFNDFVRTPVVITTLVLFLYLIIELFNPNANSFNGWYQAFRRYFETLLLFFISYKVLDNYRSIRRFLTFLFIVCVITGLYACIQQWHGLFASELKWVMEDKTRFGLIYIDGNFRKFSTMSDPTAFGIVMASCLILFSVIALNEKKWYIRLTLIVGLIFMFLGMAYSGTRTANAMAGAGLIMFVLLILNKKIGKIFAIFLVLAYLFIMYVPIYGNGTINRFRTTFNATQDASYQVRETHRAYIQPYIYTHPIGGGLGTTGDAGVQYNPGHFLAGFPPDSGYLKAALETGWIGLTIICILYFVTLRTSIRGYFESKDNNVQMLFAGCAGCLFAFYLADFAQEAILQITAIVVYYPIISLTLRLRNLNKKSRDKSVVIPVENMHT